MAMQYIVKKVTCDKSGFCKISYFVCHSLLPLSPSHAHSYPIIVTRLMEDANSQKQVGGDKKLEKPVWLEIHGQVRIPDNASVRQTTFQLCKIIMHICCYCAL
jgi:hypothetical protein